LAQRPGDGARRLYSILKGVAGQVGGLLWDDPESDPATANDENEDDSDDGTARAN
jgi:hypothetical protein